jgi:predicted nicotinamide N-methyase
LRDLVEESVALRGTALHVLRPRDADALLDEHAFDHEEYLPYWAELWPSGVALARRVAVRALRGARVLELGCGLGLPSLAAALAGGRVLATDWSPQAVELLEDNAARNGAALETALVDWSRPAAIVERAPWDLVLAADVLYERRNVAPLLDLLPQLLGDRGELWLADPGRAPAAELLSGLEGGWDRRDEADGRVTVHRLMRAVAPVSSQ